jgi:hypothetical protein
MGGGVSGSTGCAVTLCIVLSQASAGAWAGLLPEEVKALLGVTICKKSPSEAKVVMAADKHQEVAAPCQAVLAIAGICETAWSSWRGLFSK